MSECVEMLLPYEKIVIEHFREPRAGDRHRPISFLIYQPTPMVRHLLCVVEEARPLSILVFTSHSYGFVLHLKSWVSRQNEQTTPWPFWQADTSATPQTESQTRGWVREIRSVVMKWLTLIRRNFLLRSVLLPRWSFVASVCIHRFLESRT